MTDHAAALLAAILAELQGLRADLARRDGSPPARAPNEAQADALALLLPVLAEVFGTAPFFVWQALDIATQRTANGASLRLVLAGRDAAQLGKLLQAGQGRDCAGLRIVRNGTNGHVARWRVSGVPGVHPGVPPPRHAGKTRA